MSSSGVWKQGAWTRPSLDARIIWIERNPHYKRAGSAAAQRFSRYHGAATVGEYLERGGTWADLRYDADHNLLAVVKEEPSSVTTNKGGSKRASSGGIYIVTLSNDELISTQAHDARYDGKLTLKVNREHRKFGKAQDFSGRERQGYYQTFGEPNVTFMPIVEVSDIDAAERVLKHAFLPWRLRSPAGRLTEWTAGIETKDMIAMILETVNRLDLPHKALTTSNKT